MCGDLLAKQANCSSIHSHEQSHRHQQDFSPWRRQERFGQYVYSILNIKTKWLQLLWMRSEFGSKACAKYDAKAQIILTFHNPQILIFLMFQFALVQFKRLNYDFQMIQENKS